MRGPAPSADEPLVEQSAGIVGDDALFLPLVLGGAGQTLANATAAAAEPTSDARIEFLVSENGIYRVTYEELLAAGFDLTGVTSAYLALTNQGEPVRMRVVAARTFGSGAFIEFYGEGLDTLYTDTNVYTLQVEAELAFRTYRNRRRIRPGHSAPEFYIESFELDENTLYINHSPTGDPWFMKRLFARGTTPAAATYDLSGVDHVVNGAAPATLDAVFFGVGDGGHSVRIDINGRPLVTEQFSGWSLRTPSTTLPDDLLTTENSLTVELPADTGQPYDIVDVDSFHIQYPAPVCGPPMMN